jgi:hypothetical protein
LTSLLRRARRCCRFRLKSRSGTVADRPEAAPERAAFRQNPSSRGAKRRGESRSRRLPRSPGSLRCARNDVALARLKESCPTGVAGTAGLRPILYGSFTPAQRNRYRSFIAISLIPPPRSGVRPPSRDAAERLRQGRGQTRMPASFSVRGPLARAFEACGGR